MQTPSRSVTGRTWMNAACVSNDTGCWFDPTMDPELTTMAFAWTSPAVAPLAMSASCSKNREGEWSDVWCAGMPLVRKMGRLWGPDELITGDQIHMRP